MEMTKASKEAVKNSVPEMAKNISETVSKQEEKRIVR